MPVEITATGSDANVLEQVATDGGHPVTHQGSNRNRIEQVAADAGLGAVPWLSDAGAIVWLADNLGAGAFSYSLNATDAEILSVLGAGKLSNVSGDELEGEKVIVGGLASNEVERMAPAGIPNPAQMLALESGVYAVEFAVTNDPNYTGVSTGVSLYMGGVTLVGAGFAPLFGAGIQKNLDGTFNVIDAANQPLVSNLPSLPQGVAVIYDADTGQASVRYNGNNYGTSAVDLSSVFIMLSCNEEAGIAAENAGKAVRVRAVIDGGSFMGSYPAGTKDVSGAVV